MKYFFLVAAKMLSGLLDVVGILLIGTIALTVANNLDKTPQEQIQLNISRLTISGTLGEVVFGLAVLVLFVFIIKSVAGITFTKLLTMHLAQIEVRNAKIIASTILNLDIDDEQTLSKGEVHLALGGSVQSAFTHLLNSLATTLSELFLLVVVSATFFIVNTMVAIAAVIYFSVIGVALQLVVVRTLKKLAVATNEGSIATNDSINESLDAYKEIFVLRKAGFFVERIIRGREKMAFSAANYLTINMLPRYILETALLIGVFALVVQQFLSEPVTEAFLVVGVFLVGGARIMASMIPLQSVLISTKFYADQAHAAQSVLTSALAQPKNQTSVTGRDIAPIFPIEVAPISATVEKATFKYRTSSSNALSSVSINFAPGTMTAIVGPSGGGKTTTVDLLLGLLNPAKGSVLIDEKDPINFLNSFPGRIAYVPQKPGMIAGTIAENIALGVSPEQIDFERVQKVIKSAQLTSVVNNLPDGIHSSLGERVDSLSGGQIQRIGLARALYTDPGLIVLDEATSALDAKSEKAIVDVLNSLHGKVTTVVVAHRLSTIQHSDQVVAIVEGRIAGVGTFQEVVQQVPVIAEYVELMKITDHVQ